MATDSCSDIDFWRYLSSCISIKVVIIELLLPQVWKCGDRWLKTYQNLIWLLNWYNFIWIDYKNLYFRDCLLRIRKQTLRKSWIIKKRFLEIFLLRLRLWSRVSRMIDKKTRVFVCVGSNGLSPLFLFFFCNVLQYKQDDWIIMGQFHQHAFALLLWEQESILPNFISSETKNFSVFRW